MSNKCVKQVIKIDECNQKMRVRYGRGNEKIKSNV